MVLHSWLESKSDTGGITGVEHVIIYTDGGCIGNPGPGAWAFVLLYDGKEIAMSDGERATTNNKMELTAVIKALERLESIVRESGVNPGSVTVFTDSQYVRNGITDWINRWERNGWRTASKHPVKNQELWKELKRLAQRFPLTWKWVKGHAGIDRNEQCDSLVRESMERLVAG